MVAAMCSGEENDNTGHIGCFNSVCLVKLFIVVHFLERKKKVKISSLSIFV